VNQGFQNMKTSIFKTLKTSLAAFTGSLHCLAASEAPAVEDPVPVEMACYQKEVRQMIQLHKRR
jgi:hypothetical protein